MHQISYIILSNLFCRSNREGNELLRTGTPHSYQRFHVGLDQAHCMFFLRPFLLPRVIFFCSSEGLPHDSAGSFREVLCLPRIAARRHAGSLLGYFSTIVLLDDVFRFLTSRQCQGLVPRPWVDDSGLVSHRRASGSRPGAPEALDGVRQVGGVLSGFLGCRRGPPLHLRKQGAGVGLVELLHRVCGSGLLCRASGDASSLRRGAGVCLTVWGRKISDITQTWRIT